MTQDVYSQLSRRITEARHRWDLYAVTREATRLETRNVLSAEERKQLTEEYARKEIELINREVASG